MTPAGRVYGEALYSLAREEDLTEAVLEDLTALDTAFRQEQGFVRLLCAPNIPKEERCRILDDSFRGKVQPYVLNFLKLLTENGYMRQFSACCAAYREQYNEDHGILPVRAVTAVPLSNAMQDQLTKKLARITGKRISLECRVDPRILGGVRLDFDGKRLDDTVQHRLETIGGLLKNTVL